MIGRPLPVTAESTPNYGSYTIIYNDKRLQICLETAAQCIAQAWQGGVPKC